MRRLVALAAVLVAAGCGDGGSEPPPTPAALVATSQNPLAASVVGQATSAVPEFEVRSSAGRAIGGIPVTVTVSAGGGTLTGAPTVTLSGPTPIGAWVLGPTVGTQSVTVTVADLPPLEFTVEAQAGAPAELQVVDGHNQFGVAETAAAIPLRVRVLDEFGNPVTSVAVAWSVAAGGGALAATTSSTDAEGIATAPAWTLGTDDGGEEAVVATLGALTARFVALIGAVAANIVVEVPPPATSPVGEPLAPVPAFSVRDADDVAISGFPVEIAVSAGGGTIAAAPTSTVTGATPIGEWTLGTTAAEQRVTISVIGLAPSEIAVQAVAGPVDTIAIVSGDGQSAAAGARLPTQPRVRVADRFGNPVQGATINWRVTAGGGTLSTSTTFSGADGQANAPQWRLGRIISPQTLRGVVNFKGVVVEAEILTNYFVDVRYVDSPPTAAIRQAFSNAARRIEAAVVGDEADVDMTGFDFSDCRIGVDQVDEVIDDVLIFALIEPIDGPGERLGSAGPCVTRGEAGATIIGGMRFDADDLEEIAAQGRLEAVILHEMLHVVGFGTLWGPNGLLAGAGSATVRFTGARAREACVDDHAGGSVCGTAVPVENCIDAPDPDCGPGTQDSHWKESIFIGELMTGYLSAGLNPFSKMSIQSLGDIGYNVNPLAAESYTVPPSSPGLRAPDSGSTIRLPAPTSARYMIDAFGNITPIPDR